MPQQAMPACCAYEHMCLPRMRCAAHLVPRGVAGPAVHLQRPLVMAHPLHLLSSWYPLDTVSQFPHVLLPAPPCPSAVLCADHVLTTCRPTGGRSTSLPSGAAWWILQISRLGSTGAVWQPAQLQQQLPQALAVETQAGQARL